MAKPDIKIIANLLTDRIDSLVHVLLPRGKRHGHEWRVGSLAGEPGHSLSVNIGSSRPGVWKDFSSSTDHGDAFDLVACCLFGGDKKQALAWAISWLGLDDFSPDRLKQTRRTAEKRKSERELESRHQKMKTRKHAHKIWIDAEPIIAGTLVDKYLKGRGIDISKLEFRPGSIRFASAIREPSTKQDFPAMVTCINGVTGNFAAVHRTFLQVLPDGQVVKADVRDSKMVLGSFKGGCIRLWRGEDIDPETGEIKRGLPWGKIKQPCRLTIIEGIEDGLTIALVKSDRRIAASVTIAHMSMMMLPECFEEVQIIADNDKEDSKAAAALNTAITNFQKQGRKVFISRAPAGFKDVNELLNREGS